MKVASCSIINLENNYLREFIEYQKYIGFDKVFIYDHNNEENPKDVINDYIETGFVTLIPWQSHKVGPAVTEAFQDCLDNNKNEYDWILFCDVDEYLILKKDKNVKEYLSRYIFKNVNIIKIHWLNYNDNNELYYSDVPQNIRFTTPCNSDNIYGFEENSCIKSFINCKNPGIDMIKYLNGSPHCPLRFYGNNRNYGRYNDELNITNNAGVPLCWNDQTAESKVKSINYTLAALKHFRFKTIDEYCNNKIKKLTLLGYKSYNFNYINFCKYNQHTEEKLNIYRKYNKEFFGDISCAVIIKIEKNTNIDNIKKLVFIYKANCFDKIIIVNSSENNIKELLIDDINLGYVEIYNEIEFNIQDHIKKYNYYIFCNVNNYFILNHHISIQHFISDINNINTNYNCISIPVVYFYNEKYIINYFQKNNVINTISLYKSNDDNFNTIDIEGNNVDINYVYNIDVDQFDYNNFKVYFRNKIHTYIKVNIYG